MGSTAITGWTPIKHSMLFIASSGESAFQPFQVPSLRRSLVMPLVALLVP